MTKSYGAGEKEYSKANPVLWERRGGIRKDPRSRLRDIRTSVRALCSRNESDIGPIVKESKVMEVVAGPEAWIADGEVVEEVVKIW